MNDSGWDEHAKADHPLSGMTFNEIRQHLKELEQEFAGYTDLAYEHEWDYRHGCYRAWYKLTGIPTPLAKALE